MKETNNAKMQQIQSSRKQGQPVLSHIDSLQNQHLFLINELQSSQWVSLMKLNYWKLPPDNV